jgi:hypothetical protein
MLSEYSTIQPQRQRRKRLAIVSFVLGIISILILGLSFLGIIMILPSGLVAPVIINRLILGLYVVGAIAAITLGSVALNKIKKEPATYGGQGIAIAGIVTGAGPLLLIAGLVTAILIRSLPADRELATIKNLYSIGDRESQFWKTKHRFGTLKELSEAGYLDSNYANGDPVRGYIYTDDGVDEDGYCIKATRQSPSTASRDFNMHGGEVFFVESEAPSPVACGKGKRLGGG